MSPHEKIKRQKICNGVAKYIAKRLKTDVILECFAGNGFLTAQLAQESNFVLAVDTCKNIIHRNKANQTTFHCKHDRHRIEYICSEL